MHNPMQGYIAESGVMLRALRKTVHEIKALCEDGERSGADRLDEIYKEIIAAEALWK
jgi:hypothetical protein